MCECNGLGRSRNLTRESPVRGLTAGRYVRKWWLISPSPFSGRFQREVVIFHRLFLDVAIGGPRRAATATLLPFFFQLGAALRFHGRQKRFGNAGDSDYIRGTQGGQGFQTASLMAGCVLSGSQPAFLCALSFASPRTLRPMANTSCHETWSCAATAR